MPFSVNSVKRTHTDMQTRGTGANPKKPSSGKKRVRRNLDEALLGNDSPLPPRHPPVQHSPATTLSSQSIPPTRPLHGFAAGPSNATHTEVQNDDALELDIHDRDLDRDLDELLANDGNVQGNPNVPLRSTAPNSRPNASSHRSNQPIGPPNVDGSAADRQNLSVAGQNADIETVSHSSQPTELQNANADVSDRSSTPIQLQYDGTNANNRSSRPIELKSANNNVSNRSGPPVQLQNDGTNAIHRSSRPATARNAETSTANRCNRLMGPPNREGRANANHHQSSMRQNANRRSPHDYPCYRSNARDNPSAANGTHTRPLQQANPFALEHGRNYQGMLRQPDNQVPSTSTANQQEIRAPLLPATPIASESAHSASPSPTPPMANQSGERYRDVFSANRDLQMPSQRFYEPPMGLIQVDTHFDATGAPAHRDVQDMRLVYLEKLRQAYARLTTEGIPEAELQTILERSTDLANRITNFVEARGHTRELPPAEFHANTQMWEEATNLADAIKTDINTKLMYYRAGAQPNAQPNQSRQDRKLQIKLQPFGGAADQWPNFRAQWLEFYHHTDMTDYELFVKLDEFIEPDSEAHRLIQSYDRSINGMYQDAWAELCARYDNPRRHVDTILTKLTHMEPIEDHRDHYLRAYTSINQFVHSLPRMNVDVSSWEPMIVHVVERRMQDYVLRKWQKARHPREVARLQPLIDFLVREFDSGDSSTGHRRRQQPQQQNQRHQQAHRGEQNQNNHRGQEQNQRRPQQAGPSQPANNGRQRQNGNAGAAGAAGGAAQRPRSAIQKVLKCAICNSQDHKTYLCPTFLKLDLVGRVRKLQERRLCEKCLRPNCNIDRCTLQNCTNPGCGGRHNRLICQLAFAPTVNNAQPTEQQPPTQE